MTMTFEKATLQHKDIIFDWLAEPHMQEFWDNSQEHKDDILNFIHERQQNYFYGTTKYWIGITENQPFCFLLTDQMLSSQDDLSDLHKANLSESGHTIGLDFGIGNTVFLGKGLAAPTLRAFVDYFTSHVDQKADTFFIDPDENNPRAQHVYEKAGFHLVGDYIPKVGAFIDQRSYLMVRKCNL